MTQITASVAVDFSLSHLSARYMPLYICSVSGYYCFTDITISKSMATLHDFPDELVLEVVHHFSHIPYGPSISTMLDTQWNQSERRLKNQESQLALRSLCLTSLRLRKIATPFLYESFGEMPTWHGAEPLQLFLRTISSPEPGMGLQVRLVTYLQYVESLSEDQTNRRFQRNRSFEECIRVTAQYFQLLAEIVKCATNLRRLSIVSMESEEISFWKHVLLTDSNSSSTLNCLQKLQFLYFGGYGWRSSSALYTRIYQAMVYLPMLKDIRVVGIVSDRPTFTLHGTFTSVQRLDFIACKLNLGDVVEVLAACNGLQHIKCSWSVLQTNMQTSKLYAALWRHKMSLKTLHVDIRSGRFSYGPRLGSLEAFTALESLCICETSLLGTIEPRAASLRWGPPPRISQLLPVSLKDLTLLVYSDYAMENGEPSSLLNLAEDSQYYLPALKQAGVDSYCNLSAPDLTQAFEEVGVRLWYTSL
jgi:hypothetical protein